jgi:hypothetical protein
MLTFLKLYGYRAVASDQELAEWIVTFSSGASPGDIAREERRRHMTDT